MPFTKKRIEEADGRWEDARETNVILAKLKLERANEIAASGDLARSKIAWKIAVFRQALTYRVVDLADASISEWMRGNTLSALVLARALIETTALTHFYAKGFRKALDNADLAELNRLAMQGTFGGKHPYWQLEGSDSAINVMTALDHMSKEMPGARDFYERISEIAHPNAQGVHQFYATTDAATARVSISRQKRGRGETLPHLLAALFCLEWAVLKLGDIDELVTGVADLHEARSPVR